jgi:outer membrane protein TolC
VVAAARSGNLDLHLAQARFRAAAKAQGLRRVTDVLDVEVGGRRDTVSGPAEGTEATGRGYELALTLPIFDVGDLKREAMSAGTLAAAFDLEAALRDTESRLRESYSAYRTAYDIARHYRQEIIPLHRLRAEENVLLYNGMLIGIFDLLADARAQTRAVMAAIDALEQLWLADAALRAAMMGTGQGVTVGAPGAPEAAGDRNH